MRLVRWLALAALATPGGALAQEGEYRFTPHITADIESRFFSTRNYGSTLPERRRNWDTYTKTEAAFALHATESLSLQGVVKFEPLREAPLSDRAFADQGAFLESLFVQWQTTDTVTLFGGKFTAPFGTGYESFPGIRGKDFAETYEFAERLGAGVDWTFLSDPRFGEHDLRVAVFRQDTSSLTETAFTRPRFGRDRVERARSIRRYQGGPSNDGTGASFVASLYGDLPAPIDGLAYTLGASGQRGGVDGTATEWAYVAGLSYTLAWTTDLKTSFWAEAVQFINAAGKPLADDGTGIEVPAGERRRLSTLAARTEWHDWRAAVVWQRDDRSATLGSLPGYNTVELSVGRNLFTLDAGVTKVEVGADIGWSRTRNGDSGTPVYDRAVLGLVTLAASF